MGVTLNASTLCPVLRHGSSLVPAYSPVSSGCQGGFHTSTSVNVSRYPGAADRGRTGAPALEERCAAITPQRQISLFPHVRISRTYFKAL